MRTGFVGLGWLVFIWSLVGEAFSLRKRGTLFRREGLCMIFTGVPDARRGSDGRCHGWEGLQLLRFNNSNEFWTQVALRGILS